jgi:hypothetical protein
MSTSSGHDLEGEVMVDITIKISDRVLNVFKQRAKANNRSLNDELLWTITDQLEQQKILDRFAAPERATRAKKQKKRKPAPKIAQRKRAP